MLHEHMRGMDSTPESITGRFRALRIRAGLNMTDLAKAMGRAGASSIQRYESPTDYAGGFLKRDLVADLAKAVVGKGSPPIGLEEVWELAGPEFSVISRPSSVIPPNALVGDTITKTGPMIPVFGSAVGGVDGEFIMNGSKLYEVMAPPNIRASSGAYAVTVSGESMEPRYYDGEVVFVDPSRRVTKGCFVVAQIQHDEHGPMLAYVKQFIRHNSDELILSQFNPMKELRFEHQNVLTVHRVVLGGES